MNTTCGSVVKVRLQDLHQACSDLAVVVYGYIIPSLAVIVTIINIMVVWIFTKPRNRSRTSLILTLIAFTDTLNIITPSAIFIYYYFLGHYVDYVAFSICRWIYILCDVIVDMLNMISLWLTVLLAYVRCRCLKSPFRVRHVHQGKCIILCVIGIAILAIIVHLPSFFIFEFIPVIHEVHNANETIEICGITEPDGTYFKSCTRRKIHVLMETVFDSFVPCIVLVYFNLNIVASLRKANRTRNSLRHSDEAHSKMGNIQRSRHNALGNETDLNDDVFDEQQASVERNDSRAKESVKHVKEGCDAHRCFMCVSCSSRDSQKRTRQSLKSSDSSLDKLDNECQRTSWLIFMVATVIVMHEFPFATANLYLLFTHRDVQLPLNMHGCFSIVILLWQYITYPFIFIIYASMSSSFRSEIGRIVKCQCNREIETENRVVKKMFMSPCSVRKAMSSREDSSKRLSQFNENEF